MIKSFQTFLNEMTLPDKNVHLMHLEDAVFHGGIDGVRNAIFFLRSLRDMLAGNAKAGINVTVKWDGCVHPNSKLLTLTGQKNIKDLKETDLVLTKDEKLGKKIFVKFTNKKTKQTGKKWVKIILENGKNIKVTEDHKILTTNRGWQKAKDLDLKDDIESITIPERIISAYNENLLS